MACDILPLAMFLIDCFSNCNGVKTYDIDGIDEDGRVNIISIPDDFFTCPGIQSNMCLLKF